MPNWNEITFYCFDQIRVAAWKASLDSFFELAEIEKKLILPYFDFSLIFFCKLKLIFRYFCILEWLLHHFNFEQQYVIIISIFVCIWRFPNPCFVFWSFRNPCCSDFDLCFTWTFRISSPNWNKWLWLVFALRFKIVLRNRKCIRLNLKFIHA